MSLELTSEAGSKDASVGRVTFLRYLLLLQILVLPSQHAMKSPGISSRIKFSLIESFHRMSGCDIIGSDKCLIMALTLFIFGHFYV